MKRMVKMKDIVVARGFSHCNQLAEYESCEPQVTDAEEIVEE